MTRPRATASTSLDFPIRTRRQTQLSESNFPLRDFLLSSFPTSRRAAHCRNEFRATWEPLGSADLFGLLAPMARAVARITSTSPRERPSNSLTGAATQRSASNRNPPGSSCPPSCVSDCASALKAAAFRLRAPVSNLPAPSWSRYGERMRSPALVRRRAGQ
jgi:hypothetical protein